MKIETKHCNASAKAVRVASEMTAKELTAALAPLYEEIPNGHRVKPHKHAECQTTKESEKR
jgi:hypothetical protein